MNATTNHDNTTMHRTLTVRVASPSDAFEKVSERFDALDRGKDIDPLYEITFQREEDLQRLLSANNIQLLRSIARESPESIRALAREVGRDIRQVHDNLQELETYGLVELKDEGRSRRPSVWYDDIEIKVPIAP